MRYSVVGALLVLFTAWPGVHIALVESYHVNPWKLAGWGMYSAPQLPLTLGVTCLTPDEIGAYELGSVPVELQPVLQEFLRRRRGLGDLVQPARLGAALLGHYTAIDGVEIVVLQSILNRRTGMIDQRSSVYVYGR